MHQRRRMAHPWNLDQSCFWPSWRHELRGLEGKQIGIRAAHDERRDSNGVVDRPKIDGLPGGRGVEGVRDRGIVVKLEPAFVAPADDHLSEKPPLLVGMG